SSVPGVQDSSARPSPNAIQPRSLVSIHSPPFRRLKWATSCLPYRAGRSVLTRASLWAGVTARCPRNTGPPSRQAATSGGRGFLPSRRGSRNRRLTCPILASGIADGALGHRYVGHAIDDVLGDRQGRGCCRRWRVTNGSDRAEVTDAEVVHEHPVGVDSLGAH